MRQQWIAAYSSVQAAEAMADYMETVVDKDDIHVIVNPGHAMFINLRSTLQANNEGIDYDAILSSGGALLVVDADEADADRVGPILRGEPEGYATEDAQEMLEAQRDDTPTRDRYDATSAGDYRSHIENYRADYSTRYAGTGHPFDYYSPAYELGHRLGQDIRYQEYSWEELEPSARSYWERNFQQYGAWDDFRDATRHSWQMARTQTQ